MPAINQVDSGCATPKFWRDAQLPFIEARSIAERIAVTLKLKPSVVQR